MLKKDTQFVLLVAFIGFAMLLGGLVIGRHNSSMKVPSNVRAQVAAGHICTLEPDVAKNGQVNADWYCK